MNDPKGGEFPKRRALILNHQQAGRLPHHVAPTDFLAWAKANEVAIDPNLVASVEAYFGAIADWRHECERLRTRLTEAEARVATEIHPAKRENAPFYPKEKTSLLKLVGVMAMDNYGYLPDGRKSRAPKLIRDALEQRGMSMDEGTILKWLNEFAEHCDPVGSDP